jgi:RimJ/RimL family protein N-acetyltransferase
MAWSMYTDAQHADSHDSHDSAEAGAEPDSTLIGMIFLVDIDWWNKSARLQVVLGVDYRGRGYSRDAMPRVMTFAFARRPVGLGLERIWLSLPDANTRNSSVYESLGFDLTGHSRNAMWDSRDGEYHDVLIYDEIAEEYDPIRSLAAFGLHNIIDNPGVKEALAARNEANESDAADSEASDGSASSETAAPASHADSSAPSDSAVVESAVSQGDGSASAHADSAVHTSTADEESSKKSSDDALDDALSELSGEYGGSSSVHTDWAYGDDAIRQPGKKRAWWRNLGRNRNRKGDES